MYIQFDHTIASVQSFVILNTPRESSNSQLEFPIKNIKFAQLQAKLQFNCVIDKILLSNFVD